MTTKLLDQPVEHSTQYRLLLSWLVAAGPVMRALWDELPMTEQELLRIDLCRIGLTLHVGTEYVTVHHDPRD